jgi:hypothetical protein
LTVLLLMSSTARVKRFLVEVLINQSWTTPQVIHSVETALLTWDVQNMSRVSLDEALESDMRFRVRQRGGEVASVGPMRHLRMEHRYETHLRSGAGRTCHYFWRLRPVE